MMSEAPGPAEEMAVKPRFTAAAGLAVATFVVLRRFAIQTYYLAPVGAIAGMIWVLIGMH